MWVFKNKQAFCCYCCSVPSRIWLCNPTDCSTLGFSVLHRITLLLLLSRFSRVRLCLSPQTVAYQAPLSLGFSRQDYWSGLPFPSPLYHGGCSNWCPLSCWCYLTTHPLNVWGCWYSSQQSWWKLVFHPYWHFPWCTLCAYKLNKQGDIIQPCSPLNFEPISCSMSDSNCCFLTHI